MCGGCIILSHTLKHFRVCSISIVVLCDNFLLLSILVAHRPPSVQLFCQILRIPAVLITGKTAPF